MFYLKDARVDTSFQWSEFKINKIENPRNTVERGLKTMTKGTDMGARGAEADELQSILCFMKESGLLHLF